MGVYNPTYSAYRILLDIVLLKFKSVYLNVEAEIMDLIYFYLHLNFICHINWNMRPDFYSLRWHSVITIDAWWILPSRFCISFRRSYLIRDGSSEDHCSRMGFIVNRCWRDSVMNSVVISDSADAAAYRIVFSTVFSAYSPRGLMNRRLVAYRALCIIHKPRRALRRSKYYVIILSL